VKVPSPWPSRTLTEFVEESVTARSGIPSPLKSPTASWLGPDPEAGLEPAIVNVPSPFPSRIVTTLELAFNTPMSSLPSPLKSATTIGPKE
jgi:hypothetical protein